MSQPSKKPISKTEKIILIVFISVVAGMVGLMLLLLADFRLK